MSKLKTAGANTATATSAPAKNYQVRETAASIRALFSAFAQVQQKLVTQRGFYLCTVVVGSGILWFLWEVLGKRQDFQSVRAMWGAYLVLGLLFLLFTSIPRRVWLHRKLGIPVFRGSGGGIIFFIMAIFFGPLFLEMLTAEFDSSVPPHAVVLEYLKQGTTLSANPQPVLLAGALAIISMWLLLLCLKWRRLGRIMPQAFESCFIASVIERLSREVPAEERISLSMNPFPVEWSEESKQIAGREAFFDTILNCKIPLGNERRFSFLVLHRRTSKGRRKHKGYKHKIKFKYQLTGNTEPLRAASNSLFRSIFEKALGDLNQKPILAHPGFGSPDRHKFRKTLEDVSISVEPRADGALVVVQTVTVPCVSRKDLIARDLLHPHVILATVLAMSELYSNAAVSTES